MKSFQGKTAVVTGAGSGLGRCFALQLADLGANLALVDLDRTGLDGSRGLLEGRGVRISAHQVDVSDWKAMEKLARDVLEIHGGADLLINNAGICLIPQPFEEIPPVQFKKVIDVNLWGAYYGILAFLPQLKSRREAAIVNVSSLAGIVGLYGHSAYSASKAALRGLSESLQCELSGSGVHLTLVHPGGVKTNLIRNAPNLEKELREKAHQNFTDLSFLDPDQTASRILRAVQRERNRVIIGLDARLILLIKALFPRKYPAIIQAVFRQASFKDDPDWKRDKRGSSPSK